MGCHCRWQSEEPYGSMHECDPPPLAQLEPPLRTPVRAARSQPPRQVSMDSAHEICCSLLFMTSLYQRSEEKANFDPHSRRNGGKTPTDETRMLGQKNHSLAWKMKQK